MTSAPYVQALLAATKRPMGLFGAVCERLGMESIWHREGIVLCLFLFLYTLRVVRGHSPVVAFHCAHCGLLTGCDCVCQVFAWRVRRLQYRSKQDLVAFRWVPRSVVWASTACDLHDPVVVLCLSAATRSSWL